MEINFYSEVGAEFTFAMTKKISFEMIVGIVPLTYNHVSAFPNHV
jgi:hypothetical protein